MRSIHGLLAIAATLPLSCLADDGSTAAQLITVQTKTPGTFEVVYHRVDANMAGAAFFGLVGAAVQGGSQAGQDSEKTKQVLPKFTDASCDKPVVAALQAKLQEAGFTLGSADAKTAPVAVVEIKECSLRLVDTAQMQVASFVTLALGYRPQGARLPTWTETIQITGKVRRSFDDFVNEAGLAQSELTEALTRAGNRAANKLIYRDKGNP